MLENAPQSTIAGEKYGLGLRYGPDEQAQLNRPSPQSDDPPLKASSVATRMGRIRQQGARMPFPIKVIAIS